MIIVFPRIRCHFIHMSIKRHSKTANSTYHQHMQHTQHTQNLSAFSGLWFSCSSTKQQALPQEPKSFLAQSGSCRGSKVAVASSEQLVRWQLCFDTIPRCPWMHHLHSSLGRTPTSLRWVPLAVMTVELHSRASPPVDLTEIRGHEIWAKGKANIHTVQPQSTLACTFIYICLHLSTFIYIYMHVMYMYLYMLCPCLFQIYIAEELWICIFSAKKDSDL